MEIRNFITFMKIVELGSFTKASNNLGYAQSTITSHIQQIEDYLEAPIFERLGHKIVLTQIGNELLAEVEALLQSYEKIEQLNSTSSKNHPTIRIGVEETIALYKLKNLFKDYKSIYPNIDIILINDTYNDLKIRLRNGDVDIIFIIDKEIKEKDFCTRIISKEEMGFVCSPDYEQKNQENIFKYPKIILTRKGGTYREIFEKYLKEKNIIHETVLEAWSVEIVKQSLVLGMGISILPKISVLKELRDGSLVYESAKIDKKNTIYSQLIYHKNKKITKELQELITLVEDLQQRTLIK
ncbi:MAG: LysR family transcriptional regulator [Bacillota bacterium]|nr:LysR family transcriptional regulator [Bacillota bacterium]